MSGHNNSLVALEQTIRERLVADPANSYVARLVGEGAEAVLKKIGEEAIELILAAGNGNREEICHEAADLVFHLLVLLAQNGLSLDDVVIVLESREGVSGLVEKALRSSTDSG